MTARHHHHGPRGRPPWWPADEPWPPQRPPWRGSGKRFFWRFAIVAFGFALLAAFGLASLAWIMVQAFTHEGGPGRPPFPLPFFPVAIVLVLVLIGAMVGGGRALRRVAAPLGDVVEAAGRVAAGDYAARVQPRGPDEVRSLIGSFNAMAERLARTDEQRRKLLADVSHELRTPISIMQAEIEALLDGVHERNDERLASLLEETRVLARLVDDLRTLSLAESGALVLHREPVDLGALAEDAVDAFRTRAAEAGVALAADVAPDVPAVDADPGRLREVLANLIENAVRHTPSGGRVDVAVREDGADIAVSVRDTGEGIAPEALPRVFDRFYRGAGGGTGLGLAIAKDLIEAHGGTIGARSDGAGSGTEVRFTLRVR